MSLSKNITRAISLSDLAYWGIRASVGVIFLVYGIQKFDPMWQEILLGFGLPAELQIPVALAETIGGIMLIAGVMTRITGVIFSIILVDAIFHIRWENGFFIAQGGWDYDLALLAMVLYMLVMGPGRLSVYYKMRNLSAFLQ
jgi:putative oxidoreductase